MKIACVQQTARDVKNYKVAWSDILSLIDNAAEKDADIILLPECSYPGYYLGYDIDKTNEAMEYIEEIIKDISLKAIKHKTYIAIGIVLKKNNEFINGGLLFNPLGEIIMTCGKSNLWHFDHKWFNHGKAFSVVETEIGNLSMMVCADGRAPEIARILALKGADLILDMANLTSSGSDPSKLTNPQYEYMLPARALENGVWIAMADKVGLEANSVLYSGKSCVINPEGDIIASASSDKEEIIYAEIDLAATKKELPKRNPRAYKLLTLPTKDLPIYKDLTVTTNTKETEVYCAVAQFEYDSMEEYIAKAVHFTKTLEDLDCRIIMFPQLEREMDLMQCIQKITSSLSDSKTIVALTGYCKEEQRKYKSTIITSKEMIFGIYDKIHNIEEGIEDGIEVNIIDTPYCKIGVMHDQEGLIPEFTRCLMLGGADIVLWADNSIDTKPDIITRTRAAENKIYILRTSSKDKDDYATITSPEGRTIASTISGIDQSTSALMVIPLCKSKTIVPGTNVVLDRIPALYNKLVKLEL
jgi:predicted amidohydrolase